MIRDCFLCLAVVFLCVIIRGTPGFTHGRLLGALGVYKRKVHNHHRSFRDIKKIIEESFLEKKLKDTSVKILPLIHFSNPTKRTWTRIASSCLKKKKRKHNGYANRADAKVYTKTP